MRSMAKEIRHLLVNEGIRSNAEFARLLGITPQASSQMMKRDNFTVGRLEEVANALGYDMEITFRKQENSK